MLPRPLCLAISLPSLLLGEEGRADPSGFLTFIKLFLQWHSTPLHCHNVLTKWTSQRPLPRRLAAAAGWDVSEIAPPWSLPTRTHSVVLPAHVGAQQQASRWWDQPRRTCLLSSGKTILFPKASCGVRAAHWPTRMGSVTRSKGVHEVLAGRKNQQV